MTRANSKIQRPQFETVDAEAVIISEADGRLILDCAAFNKAACRFELWTKVSSYEDGGILKHNGTIYTLERSAETIERLTGPAAEFWDQESAAEAMAIILAERAGGVNIRRAISRTGAAIGAWDEEQGRFICVAGKTIPEAGGRWVSLRHELIMKHGPAIPDNAWIEFQPAAIERPTV